MRFSASRISLWMDCPLAAHFKYDKHLPDVLNAKTSFGIVVHHALKIYNDTGNVDLAVETFKDCWKNPEKLGATPETWPKFTSYGGLRDRGIEAIQRFHETLKWQGREVLAAEHRFLVPFGEHELTGVVDLLEIQTSGTGRTMLRVVDFKTKTKAPTYVELQLNQQFTVYVWASQQREFWAGNGPDFPPLPGGEMRFELVKDLPRRAIWYHLWTARELDAGARDADDFARLYRVCNEIEKAIQADVHVPMIGESCTFCAYREPCGTTVPEGDPDDRWL